MSTPDDLLPPAERVKLSGWLDPHLPGSGSFEITRISSGASNEIFSVMRSGHRWALRRPPRAMVSSSAHDVAREFRVLSALAGSEVPHPAAVLLCEDTAIIGAPFMISEFVAGFAPEPPLPVALATDSSLQRRLGEVYVDALCTIAAIPWQEVGLDGFGRPEGYLDRQASRWRGQLGRYRTRDIPYIDEVGDWIDRHKPTTQRVGLLHGDFHLPNVLLELGGVDGLSLVSVLDWEQSTIGDVLVDIGWLLALWEEPGEISLVHPGRVGMGQYAGLPTRGDIVERYARTTGLDLSEVRFYEVLANYKLACVLEGSWYRYQQGQTDSPRHKAFGRLVPALSERAWVRANE